MFWDGVFHDKAEIMADFLTLLQSMLDTNYGCSHLA